MRRAFSSLEAAALAGAVGAVLFILSSWLLRRQPGVDAPEALRAAWYADAWNRRTVVAGLNLAPFAAIAFLWFIGVIRRRLGSREDQFFSTVFQGSGLAFALLTVASAVAAATPVLLVDLGHTATPDQQTVDLAHSLWFGLYAVCASRFAAVFMIVTSTVGLRFGAFPRWLSALGYLAALMLFVTGAFSGPLAFLFPAWLIVVSATLLVTSAGREIGVEPDPAVGSAGTAGP